jgi:hypothetical protein
MARDFHNVRHFGSAETEVKPQVVLGIVADPLSTSSICVRPLAETRT